MKQKNSHGNDAKVITKDPVCGMDVDPEQAEFHSVYKGEDHYFCSSSCLTKFKQAPEQYAVEQSAPAQVSQEKAKGR